MPQNKKFCSPTYCSTPLPEAVPFIRCCTSRFLSIACYFLSTITRERKCLTGGTEAFCCIQPCECLQVCYHDPFMRHAYCLQEYPVNNWPQYRLFLEALKRLLGCRGDTARTYLTVRSAARVGAFSIIGSNVSPRKNEHHTRLSGKSGISYHM